MNNNYLLESSDFLSLQTEINKLIEKNKFNEASISTYDMDETLLKNALEDLDTYGFLTEKKVIIITNIENINQEEQKNDITHLFQYLDNPNPDNLLLICSKKLNNVLKFTKELKKKLEYIKIELNANDFIKKELENYKLEPGVINLLLEFSKEDITKLKNECDKLKQYKSLEKTISKKDVEELCIEKLDDPMELTFSFSRSLAERNKKEALNKYRELLEYNVEPLSIIGLLASQIRIIYQVKVLEKRNLSNNEIAETLGEKPFRIGKTKELIKYYTEKELLELMIKLQDIDLKVKTTDRDPNELIELFILNI